VGLAGGDVDDIGKSLPGARFGGELVEHPGGIGAVVFRLDERIALLKLVEQRFELVDRGKTIYYDPAFFFRAIAEFLFPFLAFQSVKLFERRSRALTKSVKWKN
jgi:hypothetical protein